MRAPTVEEPSNHGANRNPVSGGHFKTSRRCESSASVIFMGEYQGVWQGRSSIRLPQQWGMISPGWRQRT